MAAVAREQVARTRCRASARSNPGALRHEPRMHVPESRRRRRPVGPVRSARRDATSPTMPDRPRSLARRSRVRRHAISPIAASASATTSRVSCRRVWLASSSRSARLRGFVGVVRQEQGGGVGRLPHPPGGVDPRREHERDRLEVDVAGARSPPVPGARRCPVAVPVRIRSRPSRAMARFSPRIGDTSATVPIVARSARSRAAAGPPGSSVEQQLRELERDAAAGKPPMRDRGCPARIGLTTASAGGSTGGMRWWSVTSTSIPRRVGLGDLGSAAACRCRR